MKSTWTEENMTHIILDVLTVQTKALDETLPKTPTKLTKDTQKLTENSQKLSGGTDKVLQNTSH